MRTFDDFAKGNVYIYFENFEEWYAFKEEAKKRGFFFDSMDTFDKDYFVCANPNGYVYSQPIKVAVHYDELYKLIPWSKWKGNTINNTKENNNMTKKIDEIHAGDRVVIRNDLVADKLYGHNSFVEEMLEHRGKTLTVKSIRYDVTTHNVDEFECYESGYWLWTPAMIERVIASSNYPEINIRVSGKSTIAELIRNGRVVKKAVAKCSPEDKFNYSTGVKLAMDRLFNKDNVQVKNPVDLKIGDQVYIRKNLELHKEYGDLILLDDEMAERRGKLITVIGYDEGNVLAKENDYYYSPEMIDWKKGVIYEG